METVGLGPDQPAGAHLLLVPFRGSTNNAAKPQIHPCLILAMVASSALSTSSSPLIVGRSSGVGRDIGMKVPRYDAHSQDA